MVKLKFLMPLLLLRVKFVSTPCLLVKNNNKWRAGSRVVKAHATYAADPGWNPNWRTFAACHIPLSLPFPFYPLSN